MNVFWTVGGSQVRVLEHSIKLFNELTLKTLKNGCNSSMWLPNCNYYNLLMCHWLWLQFLWHYDHGVPMVTPKEIGVQCMSISLPEGTVYITGLIIGLALCTFCGTKRYTLDPNHYQWQKNCTFEGATSVTSHCNCNVKFCFLFSESVCV